MTNQEFVASQILSGLVSTSKFPDYNVPQQALNLAYTMISQGGDSPSGTSMRKQTFVASSILMGMVATGVFPDDKMTQKALNMAYTMIMQASGNPGEMISPAGGGSQQVFGGTVSPNGSESVTGPAIYIQDDGAGGMVGLWSKPDGVTGNTGWV